MYDKDFENIWRLPEVPSTDYAFFCSDKETISVGIQLIVIGKETKSIVVLQYELENHKWFRGPSMITPKIMYSSVSHGANAFFAGGIHIDKNDVYVVVNTVEKYNPDTKMWTVIHGMQKRRKFSSCCFLGGKFYVLGGRDEKDKHLTCGERYDEAKNSWELILDMLKDITFTSSRTPPLIAVVEDNLYLLETSSSELYVYGISANVWKKLGVVPVNAAFGLGVAFKSIGAFGGWTFLVWENSGLHMSSFSICERAVLGGLQALLQWCSIPLVYPKLLCDVCLKFIRDEFGNVFLCVYVENKFSVILSQKYR